jgi:iron complex outermembrane receptor protein
MYRLRNTLASIFLLGAPGIALAQTAPANPGASHLEEIVVTAQRREERLKDVPISIVAVSGKTLEAEHIDSGAGLNMIAPGLNFAIQGSFAQPTIRGIGSSVVGPGGDSNVAMYVDGVYQASETSNLFEFNNVERVEVLEGPQGTLFGRNATGGAIRVITRDPSFVPSAEVGYSYGSFNESKVNFYGTAPLWSDKLAGNLAGLYDRDDGYVRDVSTNTEVARKVVGALRGKLLFEPTDTLKFVLAANYSDTFDNTGYSLKPINNYSVYAGPPFFTTFPACAYCATVGITPQLRTVTADTSLTGTWKVAGGTVTSITAYQDVALKADRINVDNTALNLVDSVFQNPNKSFTQEVNYASAYAGKFNWSGGLYYINSDGTVSPFLVYSQSGTVFDQYTRVHTQAEAAFGEIYYDLTSRIHLIGGLRYSTEEKTESQADSYANLGPPIGTVNFPPYQVSARWSAWTPRASIRYDLDETSNVYFTYSEGFKSGLFQPAGNFTAASSPPVAPESVNAYELGYKLARRNFSLNASTYYYDYTNLQVSQVTDVNGNLSSVTQNARAAQIYGAELQGDYVVNEDFRVHAGAAYTHAIYTNYQGAPLYAAEWYNSTTHAVSSTFAAGDLLTGGCSNLTLCQVTLPGNTLPSADGKQMIRAPQFAANLTPSYSHPLFDGRFEGSATVSYSSGFYWDPQNTLKQPAYALVNGELAWSPAGGMYRFSVWGKNLTATKYYIFAQVTDTGNAGVLGRPLSAGVSLNVKFH